LLAGPDDLMLNLRPKTGSRVKRLFEWGNNEMNALYDGRLDILIATVVSLLVRLEDLFNACSCFSGLLNSLVGQLNEIVGNDGGWQSGSSIFGFGMTKLALFVLLSFFQDQ
jgi:hypothetical protein